MSGLGFLAWGFAAGGAALAAGVVALHLLQRFRHRTIEWAAMDFLLLAVQRQRRRVQLRDLLLLAIRTLAMLLFGLALARPYVTSAVDAVADARPVHAILVIDNSTSMATQEVAGPRLATAKRRATEFLDDLPPGSRASVVPLLESSDPIRRSAYRRAEDAVEALESIQVVDRAGSLTQVAEVAASAAARETDLPAKRVVFFTDLQSTAFPRDPAAMTALFDESLPALQVVDVRTDGDVTNTGVTSLAVADGVADASGPSRIVATIRHDGTEPRTAVPVTLLVEGQPVGGQAIDLSPGQVREVVFTHPFEGSDAGLRFAAVTVRLPGDRLPADDAASTVVPVLEGVGVIVLDDLGSREDPSRGRYGASYRLRRLLAPLARVDGARSVEEVSPAALGGARLVVVAGVTDPTLVADALAAYVRGGGRLLVAAGAAFDPVAWSAAAWSGGRGVLPIPLADLPLGLTLDQIDAESDVTVRRLDPRGLYHEDVRIPGLSEEEQAMLLGEPLFFRYVVPRADAEFEGQAEPRGDAGPLSDPATPAASDAPPRVLLRLDDGTPLVVERRLGEGRVVFIASGTLASWNTWTTTSAVVVLDRLLRGLLEETVPERNFTSPRTPTLPVPAADRQARFAWARPDGRFGTVAVEALGNRDFGLLLRDATERGLHRVSATGPSGTEVWSADFAVIGPAGESDLSAVDPALFDEVDRVRLVTGEEAPRVEGVGIAGLGSWRWLLVAVLMLLGLETLLVAGPHVRSRLAGEEVAA